VPDTAHIGPHAVIEAGVRIGERSVIGAGCYIGEHSGIGADCLIYPNVTIRERCRIGSRVIIHPGAVIGSDGFGYESGPAGHTKIPQVGIVQIDDDVEIGAQAAIDRARFGRTWIKQGTKIDNLVQIAHNVVISEHCFVIAQVGISGSTSVGQGTILAGQAGIAGHLNIGNRAIVMAQSGVSKDLADGAIVFGSPAMDRRQFARTQSHLKSLDRAMKRLHELEEDVARLRAGHDADS
jgi:UDP-3-O-[3-hydroxymyristoyl] glucosamine N-acyltransferase